MHIRRVDAEFFDEPVEHYKPADIVVSLSGETWSKLFLSQATVQELVKNKEIKVVKGSVNEANTLINMFDKYRPEKAVLVAPHLHD